MIPVAEPVIGKKELKYVTDAVKTGWVSSRGKYIKKFEDSFAKFCGTKYASSCNSGTAAIHLALLALNIKEGDEVIVPNSTYIASANPVKYVGATPVFVDSNEDTWTMDPLKIEEKINSRTRAIMVVHLYGLPCNMGPIMDLATKYNLYIIEDAAEAHGAEYNGQKVGSIGDIGCFSFFGNKIITTGEGGMCTTNSKILKERIESFKSQGVDGKTVYWHKVIGFNFRMTNIQAAIGLAQMEQIDSFLKIREDNAKIFENELKGLKGLSFMPKIKHGKQVYWAYIIMSKHKDKIAERLKEEGIDSRPFFYPITFMPDYKSDEKFPVAEKLNTLGLHLPSSAKLTKKDILKICKVIKEVERND